MKCANLSHERLLHALDYSPTSGIFTWKIRRHNATQPGSKAGCDFRGYIVVILDGVQHRAHRLAWFYVYGKWPDGVIDHINGQRSDNRISNLRDVTPLVNNQNRRALQGFGSSGFLGVTKGKGKSNWVAQIKLNGVGRRLGVFETAEQAHAAYLNAKRAHHTGCTI